MREVQNHQKKWKSYGDLRKPKTQAEAGLTGINLCGCAFYNASDDFLQC
jgi:hypothetical protein